MKSIFIALSLVLLTNGCIANAETLTSEQMEITQLIKKLYAVSYLEFDAAVFGAKYEKCKEVVKGKYEPARQCRLLSEFLVKEAIIKEKRDPTCMTGVGGYFRYPSLDGMDLSPVECADPPPVPHINTPAVNGSKAKVHVTFPINGTNVMYFLKKQPVGWRIYRIESSENSATIDTMSQGDTVNVFPPDAPSK